MDKPAIGKVFIYTASTPSTNLMPALWLARVKEKEQLHGAVFMARWQTMGRGQAGSTWLNQPGKDAAFSIFLMPGNARATNQFYLNMAVSLAVYDVLEPILGTSLRIKWPNDIFAFDKKIGGILIENTLAGENIVHSIAGIGLNINSDIDAMRLPGATSIKQCTGTNFSVVELVHKIANALNPRFGDFEQGKYGKLKDRYVSLLYKYGETHCFSQDGNNFEATVCGVSHPGKLLLKHTDGHVMAYGFKEVKWE